MAAIPPHTQRKSTVAVFVHGLFSSPKVWARLLQLLAEDAEITSMFDLVPFGYSSPLIQWNPLRRVPDLNVVAESLETFLGEQLASYKRVALIAHSQGGLVVQRYLANMLADGKGENLARIRRIVLFACPNNGSEFMLSLRKSSIFSWNIQEKKLRPLDADIMAMNVRVQNSVVHATSVALDRCPIPIVAYGGETDNIVRADVAQGYFTQSGVIPGDHFSIIQPVDNTSTSFVTVRSNLLKTIQEPMPRLSDWRGKAEQAIKDAAEDTYVVPQTFRFEQVVMAPDVPPVNIIVHAGAIDLVRNVDIVLSSENVYFEMAKPFKPSTSGRLRSAAARKNNAGEIIEDIMFNEMNEWLRVNSRHGLQVSTGTVAPTSSGELSKRGIKRVYHAAIVTPVIGTSEYSVEREGIAKAIRNIFALARTERGQGFELKSICLPLFGAGRGRMDPEESFNLIWEALKTELALDPTWEIVFATWRKSETAIVCDHIRRLAIGARAT